MNQKIFTVRRQQVFQQLPENSLVIIAANKIVFRSLDVNYPFRQDNNFYYLTGINEHDAVLVLQKTAKQQRYILFMLPRDEKMEQWTGARIGADAAIKDYGADVAYDIDALNQQIPQLMNNMQHVFYDIGNNPPFDRRILAWIKEVKSMPRRKVTAPNNLSDIGVIIHEMRLIKDKEEIALMKKAAAISADAHINAMKACKPGMMEYEIEAQYVHTFLSGGCKSVAYNPIVAAGSNACVLHYENNDKPLYDGDLLLVDAGGEYQLYAADITRTFPINGKFNPLQRDVYQLVLDAQLAGINVALPGNSFDAIQEEILKVMVAGLVDLKIIKGNVKKLIEAEAYKPYYMHSSGHWLGLDVHDVGNYKHKNKTRILEPNMVLTIEPGLYFSNNLDIDDKFKGIGIRIEDDILITQNANEVISAKAPKTIDEIEQLMQHE